VKRQRHLWSALGSLTLLLALLAGCGSDDDSGEAAVHQEGTTTGVGDTAPDFKLARLDGSLLQLSDLRGKAVLVDFWATWCPPCRAALPHLKELDEQYGDQLVVVGIALDREGRRVVEPFVQKHDISFEVVLPDDKVVDAFGGITSIPTSFLIDPGGRIVGKWVGLTPKGVYEGAITQALES
jgi:cytochrome c biogenesis protein CcmG/thiol:disulfide interchange protein DsbE